jgi:hypothetical protein
MAAKTIGFFSREVLARLGIRPGEGEVLEALWRKHIQGPLARHVYPVRYARGVLSLETDSPVWTSRLRPFEKELIARLRAAESYFQELHALRVRVNPRRAAAQTAPGGGARRPAPPVPKRPSAEAARALRATAVYITDPVLRASLEKLARHGDGD